jgi:hypothetical protein
MSHAANAGKVTKSELSKDGVASDPDLLAIVTAWPSLPPAFRAAIMAMIQAAIGNGN